MASLNPPWLLPKIFGASISIAIIALALAVSEAKHLITQSQTSLNPKSYHDHSLNTPIPDLKNEKKSFLPRYKLLIQDSINEVSRSSKDFDGNGAISQETNKLDKLMQSGTASCRELLSLASHNLNLSLPTSGSVPTEETLIDFKANLCGILAYIETCIDAFEYGPEKARNMVIASLDSLRKKVSDSLSIINDPNVGSLINDGSGWPPSWMSSEERQLLFDSDKKIRVNVVVAKDGSGKFKTISEAINFAPQNNGQRFVIHVKQGKYYEHLTIDQSRWNIMMFGDGMDKTIVSGKLSNNTGASTIQSATLAVYGRGFIAMNIGFENIAGPSGGQAVAVFSSSDKSIFYNCGIQGYQDTLFSISGRQFYRNCRISGTVDFIFGDSSAVFQSCTILVRRPLHGEANTITAQSRSNSHCQTGFSFQRSNIVAAENLAGARTFLGRPWRSYATVVFMESYLGGLIDPLGWSGWYSGGPPDTTFYGEYGNRGPGSVTSRRARSKGVRVKMSAAEAKSFTVRKLIGGAQWLPATGVPFQLDL
ncbi:hypothetical protein ACS0TY_027322 [Phlomoides rotata]